MRTFVRISCLLPVATLMAVAVACGSNDGSPGGLTPDGGLPLPPEPRDDGGTDASDSGSDAAPVSRCGNGELDPGEECDLGATEALSCKSCQIPEYTLSTLSTVYDVSPTVAASNRGYVVAWIPDEGSAVFSSAIDSSGAVEGSPKRLDTQNGATYFSDSIKLAAGSNGFLASWSGRSSEVSLKELFRPLDTFGEPQGDGMIRVDARSLYYTLVARSDSDGYLSIYSYETYPEKNWSLRQVPMSREGVPDPALDTPVVSPTNSRSTDWIAAASGYEGSSVLAWMERGKMNTDPSEVHVASIKNGKPTWSTAFPRTYELLVKPNVAMLPDGRAFVAWNAGFSNRIEVAWLGADGTPGNIVTLEQDAGIATPAIAYSPKGEVIVVWEGGGHDIRARRFSSNGSPVDTENVLITRSPVEVEKPAVAAGADGSFLVVYRESKPGNAIRYQLLPPGFRKKPN